MNMLSTMQREAQPNVYVSFGANKISYIVDGQLTGRSRWWLRDRAIVHPGGGSQQACEQNPSKENPVEHHWALTQHSHLEVRGPMSREEERELCYTVCVFIVLFGFFCFS